MFCPRWGLHMGNDLTEMQKKSSRVNGLLSLVMLGFSIAAVIGNRGGTGIVWLCICSVFVLFDLLIITGILNQYKQVWLVLRAVELIAVYILVFFNDFLMIQVTGAFLVLLLFWQFIFSFDYGDNITRALTVGICSVPGIIILIVSILFKNADLMKVFDSFILVACAIILGVFICNLGIDELGKLERKLFAQCRMVESVNEINEELKEHQEKVKRANEELGIQKIKLEAAYNRINTEMNLQNEILKAITSVIEIEKLLDIMTKSLKQELSLNCCAIILYKNPPELDDDICMVQSELATQEEDYLLQKISDGCLKKYLVKKEGFADNEVEVGRYCFLPQRQEGSLLILPLMREGRMVGGFLGVHDQLGFFTENRVFFDTIMSQFLVVLDNAEMYAKMQHMATHDGLTGLHNRGDLNVSLERFLNNAEENGMPLSLALMDIDHFKNVNDTYGHLFGDLVIRSVANQARGVAKKYGGFAARYGGEEFVVAFPGKTVEECTRYVEEIRRGIGGLSLEYEGVLVVIHVSVGVTGYPECCLDKNQILKHADAAMYFSKEHGRNRVTVDSEEILSQVGLMAEGIK